MIAFSVAVYKTNSTCTRGQEGIWGGGGDEGVQTQTRSPTMSADDVMRRPTRSNFSLLSPERGAE